MHPNYVYFWYHLDDHSFASTLRILMRIPHNQDMICMFVVFEAQLLAILLAKDIDTSRFLFFDKISKIPRKIDVYDAKSSISHERDFACVNDFAKGIYDFPQFGRPCRELRPSWRMATLNENILHDSESLPSLKSNNAILAIEVHHASRLCVFLVSQKWS